MLRASVKGWEWGSGEIGYQIPAWPPMVKNAGADCHCSRRELCLIREWPETQSPLLASQPPPPPGQPHPSPFRSHLPVDSGTGVEILQL